VGSSEWFVLPPALARIDPVSGQEAMLGSSGSAQVSLERGAEGGMRLVVSGMFVSVSHLVRLSDGTYTTFGTARDADAFLKDHPGSTEVGAVGYSVGAGALKAFVARVNDDLKARAAREAGGPDGWYTTINTHR
jgi:hypothetical protein